MKKAVWLVVILLLVTGTSALAAEISTVKIGYVDLVKALNESESGKKAKTDLEFLIKTKQTSIDEKGKAIEKAKADLEKQASVLSAEARKTKEEEMERLLRDYQRLVADSQNEVKKKESELTSDILKDLRAIVQKIGDDDGYTLILESAEGQILYAKKESDLTEVVMKKYNELKAKAKK
ncbi:MAG: OmpH family outer membrane protein [Nitrospirae bacterium]|nr:OmpH family outer membrane protein [Nitrospirota bacterium]